ncbi:hypothetical protein D3C78_1736760 [compost metagenome]
MIGEHASPRITAIGVDQHRRHLEAMVLQPQGDTRETGASTRTAHEQDLPPCPGVGQLHGQFTGGLITMGLDAHRVVELVGVEV